MYNTYFRVNQTSGSYQYETLKNVIQSIKIICKGNCPKGSSGYWEVSKNNKLIKQGHVK